MSEIFLGLKNFTHKNFFGTEKSLGFENFLGLN